MAEADMEKEFQAAIDSGKIKGVIVCATDAESNFVYEKTLGERTLLSGERRPHQLDDVLFLASATKLHATIAALQCVEDGLLSLTDDLSTILPELAAQKIITGFSEDGETPLLEPRTRPITLEMLLSHSSGATYYFLDPMIARWRQKFAPKPETLAKSSVPVEDMFDYPLSFQPGTSWMYGPGLDWAGRVVERVSGKTLGERMHERIFDPLGITDAQFYPVAREDLRARLVDLNPEDPEVYGKAVMGGPNDMNKLGKGDFGGHGLFMTAPDYVKVLHSLLANDGKILKPETVNDMFENHLSPEAAAGHKAAVSEENPFGIFFRVGTAPGSKAGYGLGGHLTLEDVDGWYGERTLTWGGGQTFAWFVDRKNDLCGVGAIQATIPTDPEVAHTLKQTFRHDIYRKRAQWKKEQA
ncbi:putative transesterase [Mollisia scopiformis]|uniref:Putative transesterase n=1 Tax=Mollisia scopiformis TaxID=149040 RepID=A0A132BBW0_MOLSC|nr:putative transesterase [Mollisia scopiformis]KUJ09137.1 putative transesterase [Mollisia scopiformis]